MKLTIFLLASTVGLAACGGGSTSESGAGSAASSAVITVDGSSTVYPVTEAVAEEFQKAHVGTRITVGISGTGGGVAKFCRDEIDIADASRPITPGEAEDVRQGGRPVHRVADCVRRARNRRASEEHLGGVDDGGRAEEALGTGRSGQSDALERRPQRVAEQRDSSLRRRAPTRPLDYFTEVIAGKQDASRGDYTSSEDDNVIVQGVSGDEYTLGYFGYAYYEENKDKLKLVAIDDGNDTNGKGPILPSPESVNNGTYRPLSRPIFIYPKIKALDRPEVASFIEFYLREGVPLVREVGYIPLTEREYELVRSRFTTKKTGSMYDGADGQSQVTLEQRLSK